MSVELSNLNSQNINLGYLFYGLFTLLLGKKI